MSHPEQVGFNVPWVKLDRRFRIGASVQICANGAFITLPIPRSFAASMAATQLQPRTVPSGKTMGPLKVFTQGSGREATTRSFIEAGKISRVIRPLAEVNDQVKSSWGWWASIGWKSGSDMT